jgi:hypothetical protein
MTTNNLPVTANNADTPNISDRRHAGEIQKFDMMQTSKANYSRIRFLTFSVQNTLFWKKQDFVLTFLAEFHMKYFN